MNMLQQPAQRATATTTRRDDDSAPAVQRWFAQMLDEMDYGMLLVLDEVRVAHVNHAARLDLDADHPLQLLGNELRVRLPQDLLPLRDAIADAARRARRCLLTLGDASRRVTVSVVPLPPLAGSTATLVLLGRRSTCEELTVQGYARSHSLTPAETEVLRGLCAGERPAQIARRQGVAISTVRTQIGSIRVKTATDSIRGLVQRVSLLPPLMTALRTGMH
jgi:DNA-binding CsgD family transcriptional regulator